MAVFPKIGTALALLIVLTGFVSGQSNESIGAPNHPPTASHGMTYWHALDSGATEEEAALALRRSLASDRLDEATHAGPIYWALIEMGASEETAAEILHMSSPIDEAQLQQWSDAMLTLLRSLDFSEKEAMALIPTLELRGAEEDLCWVYPVKIIWCSGSWMKQNDTQYINAQCWNEFFGPCLLQTCSPGEKLWYSVTLDNSCLDFLPSSETCVSMRIGEGTWVKCNNTNIFDCSCIEETQCSEVEQHCCHALNGSTGCPDCD